MAPPMNTFGNGFSLALTLCLDIGVVNTAMLRLAVDRGLLAAFALGLGSSIADLLYAGLSTSAVVEFFRFTLVQFCVALLGSAVLAVLLVRSIVRLVRGAPAAPSRTTPPRYQATYIGQGIMLALLSPSSIAWFASVGGGLLAFRQVTLGGQHGFLGGFFAGSVAWTIALAGVASRLAGRFRPQFTTIVGILSVAAYAALLTLSLTREIDHVRAALVQSSAEEVASDGTPRVNFQSEGIGTITSRSTAEAASEPSRLEPPKRWVECPVSPVRFVLGHGAG